MSFFKEFKEFAMRGNVIDLAVGVILGTAFNKIVSSLVSDIIMPPLGILIGGIDFKDFSLVLKAATESEPAVTLSYGLFLQNTFDFLIVAFSVFVAIRLINSLHSKLDEPKKAEVAILSGEEQLLTEIRNLLIESNQK